MPTLDELYKEKVKWRIGRIRKPVTLYSNGDRIFFFFGFNKKLSATIKTMEGWAWHGYDNAPLRPYVLEKFKTDKVWSVSESPRNRFTIDYFTGKNPYAPYKSELIDLSESPLLKKYPLRSYQIDMSAFQLTRKQCIIVGDRGVGKTLADIFARDIALPEGAVFAAPNCVLKAIEREFKKWDPDIIPELVTYNGLQKLVEQWKEDPSLIPQWLTCDESSWLKSPTSKRARGALEAANLIRGKYGRDGYVALLTGTPAPHSVIDYWMQCEIACPGFLAEGTAFQFKERMCVMEDCEIGDRAFKKVIAWRDGTIPGADEVKALHERLNDRLIIVKNKKECLPELPDKQYEEHIVTPSKELLELAQAIAASEESAATCLVKLRELSDGFQYVEEQQGMRKCPVCKGSGEDSSEEEPCWECLGKKEVPKFIRRAIQIPSGKQDVLKDYIESHTDIGRCVIYAGFEASVDLCCLVARQMHWDVIRVDGRGWLWSQEPDKEVDFLGIFQDQLSKFPRVAFIGNPDAAGAGLTLTASPSIFCYSNSFNAQSRMQLEDRIHRPGMDLNKGATIHDVFNLPTDKLVYRNIKEKIARQDYSLGLDVDMSKILETLRAYS